jgi:hypothetical protein
MLVLDESKGYRGIAFSIGTACATEAQSLNAERANLLAGLEPFVRDIMESQD